jgi:hypothetical protein
MQVFEYYSDAILFKGLAPTHLTTLPGDARAYHSAGVWTMGNLMVGDRPWVGPPWHAWWAASCLWDAQADLQSSLAMFCDAAYGAAGAAMVGTTAPPMMRTVRSSISMTSNPCLVTMFSTSPTPHGRRSPAKQPISAPRAPRSPAWPPVVHW